VSGGCRSPHPPQEEGFKRVVMCSGKVYYELAKKRAELKKEKEVAIIRLEQVLLFFFFVCWLITADSAVLSSCVPFLE